MESDKLVKALRASAKEIDKLRKQNAELEARRNEPIAIVGMACRYPGGANSPEALWQLLVEGRDATSSFPSDRGWPTDILDPDPDAAGKSVTNRGGFLHDAGDFDPSVFGISPREAQTIDPQQRLLLESTWEALERSQIAPDSLRGSSTGVFVGIMYDDYAGRFVGSFDQRNGYVGIGSAPSVASGRLSYTLGLEGPAVTVDTACSSSLVTLHLAARALRDRECDLALAGGATVMASPDSFVEFSRQRGLAPDGRCKSFSDHADGVAWAEGIGILVLARLSDARSKGYRIHALVSGSAINQDGRSQGLTAPNGPSQQRVIRAALDAAGVRAGEVDVVEAHGTGTRLGDPIEAQALLATYGREHDRDRPLRLGAIKSNIGHTQAAAGVAGIIKMALALEHEQLPATLHAEEPSRHVDWSTGTVALLDESLAWPREAGRERRAAVSSFGISGTNAHVILTEAPAPIAAAELSEAPARQASRPSHVPLPLSAKSGGALRMLAEGLRHTDASALDVAYSLAKTRASFELRSVAAPASLAELQPAALELVTASSRPRVAALFTGQGAQRLGMGLGLREVYPGFRTLFDDIVGRFDRLLGKSLVSIIAGQDHELLNQTQYAQPALFALEVALYRLFEAWQVEFDVLLGHSIGELAAAHVAGVMPLDEACRLVAVRGRLMQSLAPGGAMISLQASEAEVLALLDEHAGVDIAGLNGPSSTVISGDEASAERVAAHFDQLGRKTRRLSVSHAFHSHHMDPMLDKFRAVAGRLAFERASLPILSNVTGRLAVDDELRSGDYWARHVRGAVRFHDGVGELEARGVGLTLELGPHGTLSSMLPMCLSPEARDRMGVVAGLRRDRPEPETLAVAVAQLYAHGVAIDWDAYFSPWRPQLVALPTYPFQRERFWLDSPSKRSADLSLAGLSAIEHPLLGALVARADGEGYLLTARLSGEDQPWVVDHRVFDHVLFPGTGFLELALTVGARVGAPHVEELALGIPLVVEADQAVVLQVAVGEADPQGRRDLKIHSRAVSAEADGPWHEHATGTLRATEGRSDFDLRVWPPAGAEAIELDGLYDRLAAAGLAYGPIFQGLVGAWRVGETRYAEVRLSDEVEVEGFAVHPALLDAALHVLGVGAESIALPFAWSAVSVHAMGAKTLRVRARPSGSDGSYELMVCDGAGGALAWVGSLATRSASADDVRGALASTRVQHLYRLEWEPVRGPAGPVPEGFVQLGGPAATRVEVIEGLDALAGEPSVVLVPCWGQADDGPLARTTWALELLQSLLSDERLVRARLVFMTRGALATKPGQQVEALEQAPIWGLMRTAQAEHPERELTVIDVDDPGLDPRRILGHHEGQLALREGRLFVPRLVRARAAEGESRRLGPDGTVLITGATGGLGSLFARHLVEHYGVRHLLLVSRRGPDSPTAATLEAELTGLGAEVRIVACDVANHEALAALVEGIAPSAPLIGVVHAAGVLDDGVLMSLDRERLAKVFRPKVDAAISLHALTETMELSAFVLFSSAAGVLGNPGQANYAAANAYLDALASHRRARGLTGTSLVWGPWASSGMAARLGPEDTARLRAAGFPPLEEGEGLDSFDAAMGVDEAVLAAMVLDTRALAKREVPPLLRRLVKVARRRKAADGVANTELVDRLARLPSDERLAALLDFVNARAAAVLGRGPDTKLSVDQPLQELGLDSLMAVELRNSLQSGTGLRLPATLLFDHPTPDALALFVANELFAELDEPAPKSERRAETSDEDPIVVVGMACRYPGGVDSPEALWALMAEGRDATSEFPTNRGWPDDLYDPDPDAPGKSVSRRGGFLHDADAFDASVFGISPREAVAVDPQQRLLLETTWEALERTGLAPTSLRGSATGVFVGIMYNDYSARMMGHLEAYDGYVGIGSLPSVASGRLSYTLGLEGPALTVDTACSSSLVTVHLAAQALRGGECDMALAGGATVMASPSSFIDFSRQRGLALDGRCKSFSDAADGVAWGEGVGILVLERLSDARRKGHRVLAVVRGSAINQDGRSQGLTAPNGPSQQRVIHEALSVAGLSPADIDVVEAHGTGTALGDPIEAGALHATYGRSHDPARPLWLGSIKSNIGHTQAAAGVAGIIKMILAMEHEQLPRTLHVDQPSTKVEWDGSVALLQTEQSWPATGPRRAAVSSFGISGTNAHVILEAPGLVEPEPVVASLMPSAPAHVPLPISAKTEAAARAWIARLEGLDARPLDVAYSLLTTRAQLEHRALVSTGTLDELDPTAFDVVTPGGRPRLAMMFTGQGSQRLAMGRGLRDSYPYFREVFDAICARFDALLDESLQDIVFGDDRDKLGHTAYTQPALFALEVALYRLYESWGVVPEVVLGHSIGELAAAHVAGVFDLDDGCRLVAARGRLMQALPGGGVMISVQASEAELRPLLEAHPGVDIAGLNGPLSTVVSGDEAGARAIAAQFEARGRKTKELAVSHAFHSQRMDGMLEEFGRVAASVSYRPAAIRVVSNVSGEFDGGELSTAEYWVSHVRSAVRFLDAIEATEQAGISVLLELGPHGVLCSMAAGCLSEAGQEGVALVPSLRRNRAETETIGRALAELHGRGVVVDWEAYFEPFGAKKVALPTYPFQRQRYWLDVPKTSLAGVGGRGLVATEHPLLGVELRVGHTGALVYTGELELELEEHEWLRDHVVLGYRLLPATAFVELAAAAGRRVGLERVEELSIEVPLVLDDAVVSLQTSVEAEEGGKRVFSIHARVGDRPWVRHVRGSLAAAIEVESEPLSWPPADAQETDVAALYARLDALGLSYGPRFRGLERAWVAGDEHFAEVGLPAGLDKGGYLAHPALVDAGLHGLALASETEVRLPIRWRDVTFHRELRTPELRLHAKIHGSDEAWLRLSDASGRLILSAGSLVTRRGEPAELRRALASQARRTFHGLRWQPVAEPPSVGGRGRVALLGGGPQLSEALATAHELIEVSDLEQLLVGANAGDGVPDFIVVVANEADSALEGSMRALGILQRWLQTEAFGGSRLLFVTRCALCCGPSEVSAGPNQAAWWGLVRTAQNEFPGRELGLIDLDDSSESLVGLARGLAGPPELALRDGQVLAPSLARFEGGASEDPAGYFDPESSVLITGGTGGLGSLIAEHLVSAHGVQHLVLASRRGPGAEAASALRSRLEALGASVEIRACDVSDRAAVEGLLASIDAAHPLGAVVHTAGVLRDSGLLSLGREGFESVFAAKVEAALLLDELTSTVPLTAFVLFSSLSGVLGNPGQANYAAANAVLDALATHRRGRGLPGLSLAWGPWQEVGMAAKLAPQMARMQRLGIPPVSNVEGLGYFDEALLLDAAALIPIAFDVSAMRRHIAELPRLAATLVAPERSEAGTESKAGGQWSRVLAGISEDQGRERITELVLTELAWILRAERETLDPDVEFPALGVDSLMTLELQNVIKKQTNLALSATYLFDHTTPSAVAADLVERMSSGAQTSQPELDESWRADWDLADTLSFAQGREAPIEQILLTGGTGFLGTHMLLELLASSSARIHVLVRKRGETEPRTRMIEALARWGLDTTPIELAGERLCFVTGDLSTTKLGLDEDSWQRLSQTLDLVISNGAIVDWLLPYSSMRQTNVLGPLELLRLAAANKPKRFVQVSSVVACPVDDRGRMLEVSGHARPVSEMGYAWTKFVSEHFVHDASLRGLDALIVRPAAITSSSQTGIGNPEQVEWRFMRACVELGLVPDIAMNIDLTPVDIVAKMAIEGALRPELGGVLHLAQLSPYSPRWFAEVIRAAGWSCEVVATEQWQRGLEALIEAGALEFAPLRNLTEVLHGDGVFDVTRSRRNLRSARTLPNPTETVTEALERALADGLLKPRSGD